MELGMVGLGKMGSNMAQRLLGAGHSIVAYDAAKEAMDAVVGHGAAPAHSISDLISQMPPPRAVWVMVPSGEASEKTITELATELSSGDIVLDGGNSYYKDSVRRADFLAEKGLHFLDVGTSGGVWGLTEGYCLMIGGAEQSFRHLEPIFQALAPSPQQGYAHVGPSGSGHFVKMVHNGIEYGMMQAYAEGFELMDAKKEFNLDSYQIAKVWRHGSVIRSWLLDLAARALQDNPDLEALKAYVEDTGEGRWTVAESIELAVPTPVITASLQARFRSRQNQPFGVKLLAALRQQFGGHGVKRSD